VVDVKVRNTGTDGSKKDFYWALRARPQGAGLRRGVLGKGGKMVCIAMGEKDASPSRQLWGSKFPVISPQAESQIKDLARLLPQLSRYEKVVIVQDMDEPGLKAGRRSRGCCPPARPTSSSSPAKDANETILKHGAEALINAIHNAMPFRPDGIVDADDLDGQLLNPTEWGCSLPYDFL
jgi:twinkle protein